MRAALCSVKASGPDSGSLTSPENATSVPIAYPRSVTGHKTPSVFARYNIVSGTDLRDAAARLDAAAVDHKNDHTSASKTPAAGLTRQIS